MTILHIDSSINGENSASRAISRSIVDQLQARELGRRGHLSRPRRRPAAAPDARRLRRHLGARRIPGRGHDRDRRADVQFHAADPAQGVDRPHRRSPARPSATPRTGPKGLAKGKRVIIALARGGFYSEGSPAAALEHLETYLARRVQLHRHRARVRRRRRPRRQPRAARQSISRRSARRPPRRLMPAGAPMPLTRRPEPRRLVPSGAGAQL